MASGKVVVITGCSRGIGLALVKEFAQRGFKVLATCRNPEKAAGLTQILKDHQLPPAFSCDVSQDDSIRACAQAITSSGEDKVDLLINNAGVSNRNHPDDRADVTDRQELVDVFNVNVGGPLSMTKELMGLLEKSATPVVINISSLLGSLSASPRYTTTSYQCSKAALNMLSKCQAEAFAKVKFISVHPGHVQTDMGSSKGRSAPVATDDAAKGIADLADKPEVESGSFWSYTGKQLPF